VLVPQRAHIVEQTQLQYNAMQIGPIELLTAKQRHLEAERGHINAQRDYWIARTELERALHGGTSSRRAASPNDESSASPQETETSH
jgi:cobalt-zinc-cadmium efflux system outer membrane protein